MWKSKRIPVWPHTNVDAFSTWNNNIDSYYIDGISITYSSNPRQHIWTYAAGEDDFEAGFDDCPCNNGSSVAVPDFVGIDYYCESGNRTHEYQNILYVSDTLWDGQQCNGIESTCCTNPNMRWFVKTLNEETK